MAEILGVVASILTVLQISKDVASTCRSYILTVKDCPNDFRLMYIEIGTLEVIFDGLSFLDDENPDDSQILEKLRGADGPVEGCKEAMERLKLLIPPLSLPNATVNRNKRQKIRPIIDKLAWPLKAARAEKLLNEIMRHKSTINVALQGQFLKEFRGMKSQVDDIQIKLSSAEKRALCDWYEDTNPSFHHIDANRLYEPMTGNWVFKSGEWKEWIHGQTQSMFCHGIPGAGKTILASHVIEELLRMCRAENRRTTCVFYYCYNGRNQDEMLPFLRWLVSQLLRKIDEISPAACAAHAENIKPNRSLLLDILNTTLESFDRVYVAVDALDESQSRHHLLDVLEVLGTDLRFKKIRLFAMTREYQDIQSRMCRFSTPLSMSNKYVEADIATYVTARIDAGPEFASWPSKLRIEVATTLSCKARGMFRWAVCQLDIIRRLKNEGKIRESLRSLPRTLDKTYERLFASIPEEDQDFLRHTLHLLCFHNFIWPGSSRLSAQLVIDSYVVIDKERNGPNSGEYFYSIDTVKDICGCLISVIDNGTFDTKTDGQMYMFPSVQFAHYTVREFLESDRCPSTSLLKINHTSCYGIFLHALMSYVIGNKYSETKDVWELQEAPLDLRPNRISCLQSYSIGTSVRALQFHDHLVKPELAYRFLDPSGKHYFAFHRVLSEFSIETRRPSNHQINGFNRRKSFWHISWTTSTEVSCNAAILGNLLMLVCHTLARTFIQTIDLKDVLQEVLSGLVDTTHNGSRKFKCKLVELLAGVQRLDQETLSFFEEEVPGLVSYRDILPHWIPGHKDSCGGVNSCFSCILPELIELGANPDPKGFQAAPLQIATYLRDFTGVKTLLESGADPNQTGDKTGINCESENPRFHAQLQGFNPLHIITNVRLRGRASQLADPEVVLSRSDRVGAFEAKEEEIKRLLLEYGASVSSTEDNSRMTEDSTTEVVDAAE